MQPGLHPVLLLGKVHIDPNVDDFYKHVVEQKEANKADPTLKKGLKCIGNAGAYGPLVELNEQKQGDDFRLDVYSGDHYHQQERHFALSNTHNSHAALISLHFDNSCTVYRANCSRCYSNMGTPGRRGSRKEKFAPGLARSESCYVWFFARTLCSEARVGVPTSELLSGRLERVLVHASRKVLVAMTQAHPSVPCASACGIPASRPLSQLDRDKA